MNPGKLLIRADASPAIGSGHVMRCLALAEGWRRRGSEVIFAMVESSPAIAERLVHAGCRITRAGGPPGSAEDLANIKAIAAVEGPAWVVLDGYRFDELYQSEIEAIGKLLVVDDDGLLERYSADLVLNQNAHARAGMYANRSAKTRLLLGPRYALLREEFAAYRTCRREICPVGRRILLSMGGSDPSEFTPRILPWLARLPIDRLIIRVVVGGSARNADAIDRTAANFPGRVGVIHDARNMAELMAWADLAIAGAGTTCWELCFLGLPAIVVVAADNQHSVARELEAVGAAINAGRSTEVDCESLAMRAHQLLMSEKARVSLSEAAKRQVDGRGVERVLDFMTSSLKLRLLQDKDCRTLWEWANDTFVRAASFSPESISWEDHQRWFEKQMEDSAARVYVAENEHQQPTGQVRFNIKGKRATLSINVAPKLRGQGLGGKILAVGVVELLNTTDVDAIEAYVKPENLASLRLFRCAGFDEDGEREVRGQPSVRFVLKRWGSQGDSDRE